MNIYKMAYVNRNGRQIGEIENYDELHGVSTLLWEEDVPHETKLNTDDGHYELEVEVEKDTLDKLLEHYVIDLHEYNELYQAKVDFITLI